MGDLKGAKEFYEKALKIRLPAMGTKNHTDVAASYNNLGLVLTDQRRPAREPKNMYEKGAEN